MIKALPVAAILSFFTAWSAFADRSVLFEEDGKTIEFRLPGNYCLVEEEHPKAGDFLWTIARTSIPAIGDLMAAGMDCESLGAIEREDVNGSVMYHGRARDNSNTATTDNPVLQAFPGFVGFGAGDTVNHADMVPMALDRTRHTTHYYARRATNPEFAKDWCDLWDQTYHEDNVVIADQRRNLASVQQPWNRYVSAREFGAQHISRENWRHLRAELQSS